MTTLATGHKTRKIRKENTDLIFPLFIQRKNFVTFSQNLLYSLSKSSWKLSLPVHFLNQFVAGFNVSQSVSHDIWIWRINGTCSNDIHNVIVQLMELGDQVIALEFSSGFSGSAKLSEIDIGSGNAICYQIELVVLVSWSLCKIWKSAFIDLTSKINTYFCQSRYKCLAPWWWRPSIQNWLRWHRPAWTNWGHEPKGSRSILAFGFDPLSMTQQRGQLRPRQSPKV